MDADLLFKRAEVVDGSGSAPFTADVAVSGDKIAAVGDLDRVRAQRTVDAKGRVLCPGFVDMHGHSDYFLMILPSADGKVMQGVTTEVGGNCGYSGAPLKGKLLDDRRQSHKELYDLEVDWEDFPEFLQRLEASRPAMNFAPLVGFNTVRAAAGSYSSKEPSPQDLDNMKGMIREALSAGAFGVSFGLVYPPASFASFSELLQFALEVSSHGGVVASHMRSEGDGLVEAVQESVELAMQSGARFQVSHLKTSGPENWSKLGQVFELIEGARSRGLVICADRYPYLASFTGLSAALPGWIFEGGKDAFFERLADPEVRQRIKEELGAPGKPADIWDRIVISQVFAEGLEKYELMSVARCAAETGAHPVDFVCGLLSDTGDRVSASFHTMSEDNLELIYKKEWVMVGSDAAVRTLQGNLSEGKPHPRAFGAMPRVLSWVVREKGWLDLPTAVSKMTSAPCRMLEISDRGLVKEGLFADLVLFHPGRVRDTATYDHPKQYPEGIDMVVVNGKVVVEDNRLTGNRPGRVLARES